MRQADARRATQASQSKQGQPEPKQAAIVARPAFVYNLARYHVCTKGRECLYDISAPDPLQEHCSSRP